MTAATRPVRLSLRDTPQQVAGLRSAAALSRKSMNAFILDSASLAAELILLDQLASDAINCNPSPGLQDLFRRTPPCSL
jgi:uncharacterized protein (DUF1778 family)